MRTNGLHFLELLRQHFTGLGYRYLDQQLPDFGGIILCLEQRRGDPEAVYYVFKPSTIELVTSDELRRAMEFVEETGLPLQHVLTTSSFSNGSSELAAKNGLSLWELHSQDREIVRVVCVQAARRPAFSWAA